MALAARPAVAAATFQACPNPAIAAVQLALPANFARLGEAGLLDVTGRAVRRFQPAARQVELLRGGLPAGSSAVRFASQAPVRVVVERVACQAGTLGPPETVKPAALRALFCCGARS